VFTWGRGRFGRLGHNDELDRLAPTQVSRESLQNSPAVLVAAGKLTSAAVASDGSLFVWGWGQWGQLGVGDTVNRLTPERLTPEKHFEDSRVLVTSCGGFHMLAVTEYGAVWSWGRGAQAQLGHNDRHDCLVPRSIEMKRFDDLKVVTVACGLLHSVAVTEDGRLWTWGSALSTHHELAKQIEGYQEIPTGLAHQDMQDKLEPTAVQTLFEADARVKRSRRCGPLASTHAVAYAMQSRMVLDDACAYEVCMHQLVAQVVELEDEIVGKRRELRQKRRDLQERLLKSRERTTQLLFQIHQEQAILTKWQDEEVALGAALMKNEEMKGMSLREMALHTAKLSAGK
jgi:alpha-tubulin suppressor-like RCC1 family protein